MIRLLVNPYSEEELKVLHETLCGARSRFIEKHCQTRVPCSECTYRHLCYDLDKVTDHTAILRRGEQG